MPVPEVNQPARANRYWAPVQMGAMPNMEASVPKGQVTGAAHTPADFLKNCTSHTPRDTLRQANRSSLPAEPRKNRELAPATTVVGPVQEAPLVVDSKTLTVAPTDGPAP